MRSNHCLSRTWTLVLLSAVVIEAQGCGRSKSGAGSLDAASPSGGGSTAQTSQGGASGAGLDAGAGAPVLDAHVSSEAGASAGAHTGGATLAGGTTDRGGSTAAAGTLASSLAGSLAGSVALGGSGGKGGASSGSASIANGGTGGKGGGSAGNTNIASGGTGGSSPTGSAPPPWRIPSGCGDAKLDASEQCDDGNSLPFDGCSSDCRSEPTCKGVGPCTSKCGDGLLVGQECDDGNTLDGDGCSADCKVEPGFTCTQAPLTDSILLSTVYRDFHSGKTPEFEPGVTSINPPTPGMVETQLDDEGKPVYSGLTGGTVKVTSKESFATWYRNTPDVNHANPSKLRLWSNGDDTYVNRWGANGERWLVTEKAYFCGLVGDERLDSSGGKIPCTSRSAATTDCDTLAAKGERLVSCTLSSDGIYSASYAVKTMDGTPSFFPVDDDPFSPAGERQSSVISPPWDITGTYPTDVDAAGKPILHNFSFTSEFRSWFRYEAGKSAQLTLGGDDDLWVFVNKQLALDLGGIHVSSLGTLVLDDAAAAKFGLSNGSVYEIAIFHAERQSKSSILTLTLAGFNANPSVCRRN